MSSTGRRFAFGRCLGRGSFGEVYAATMRSPGGLETQVAVKLLRADIDLQGSAIQRLRDEGRVLARLNHPAILTVIDLVTLDGRLSLVTERIEGDDLSRCLASMGERALLQALGQVAGALAAANAAPGPDGPLQLVHRDVKPSNIRIDHHGRAKLLDFGIARFDASDREVRTASDLIVGSVPYMAPERFIHRAVEPSSDVFSLGCCLYEGLVGRKLYGTNKVARISGLALHPEGWPAFLEGRLKGIEASADVIDLLRELVDVDPDGRPTSASTADRLEELADRVEGPSLRVWCQRHDWPDPEPLDGALEGCTLDEHPDPDTSGDGGVPTIQRSPVETLEAASLPSGIPTVVDPELISTVEDLGPTRVAPARPVVTEPTLSLTELTPRQTGGPPVVVDPPPAAAGVGTLAVLGVVGIGLISAGSLGAGFLVFVTLVGLL